MPTPKNLHVPYTPCKIPPSEGFPDGRIRKRPIVNVTLRNTATGKTIECPALVDSGADYSAFPLGYIEDLGLDPARAIQDTLGGAMSETAASTKLFHVGICVDQLPEILALAGFNDRMHEYGVLGQADFFERFMVSFYASMNFFEIMG